MLEGTIYIETFDGGNDFSVNNDYYNEENSYINALNSLLSENNSLFGGIGAEGCQVIESECNNFANSEVKSASRSYVSCPCALNGEDIDSFIYHNINSDSFDLEISLNLSDDTEDFEYEYKSWNDYHNKVFKLISKSSDMDVLLSELPNKELRFSFTNLSGGLSYALLDGCVILSASTDRLLVRVNKLTFIKGLE